MPDDWMLEELDPALRALVEAARSPQQRTQDRGLSAHERRRWSLWLHACEHRAVLPWVRQVARLAQAAEDDAAWRGAVGTLERLHEQLDALDAMLWTLDPAWAADVLGKFFYVAAVVKPLFPFFFLPSILFLKSYVL
jgi:hypothetical protein